jgi:hypothetical protein
MHALFECATTFFGHAQSSSDAEDFFWSMLVGGTMDIFKNGEEWACERCLAQFEVPALSTSWNSFGQVVGD